ncbi:hypothetical protein V6N13_020473 [Hibiscus sabdariffa]
MEASTFISCLPIDCYLTKFNKRGEMKPAPKRSSEAFKTIKRSSLIPVQKEKQTEEMEDIETGFEDLSRNLVAPTFTILNFLLSAFEQ